MAEKATEHTGRATSNPGSQEDSAPRTENGKMKQQKQRNSKLARQELVSGKRQRRKGGKRDGLGMRNL